MHKPHFIHTIILFTCLAACGTDGNTSGTTETGGSEDSTTAGSQASLTSTTVDDSDPTTAGPSGSESTGGTSTTTDATTESTGLPDDDSSSTAAGDESTEAGTTGADNCEMCVGDAEANVCSAAYATCAADQYCGEIGSCCTSTPDQCGKACLCDAFEFSGMNWDALVGCLEDACPGCAPAACFD